MGAICGIEQQLERKVCDTLQYKLQQVQKIIEAEEKRNYILIRKLEALCDQNGDLVQKNKELIAERKQLVLDIAKSQKRLAKLHKAFLASDVTAEQPSASQCK